MSLPFNFKSSYFTSVILFVSQFSNDGGSKDTESFIDRLHEKAGKKEEKKKQGSQNSYGGEIDTREGAKQHHPIHPRFVYASCI